MKSKSQYRDKDSKSSCLSIKDYRYWFQGHDWDHLATLGDGLGKSRPVMVGDKKNKKTKNNKLCKNRVFRQDQTYIFIILIFKWTIKDSHFII